MNTLTVWISILIWLHTVSSMLPLFRFVVDVVVTCVQLDFYPDTLGLGKIAGNIIIIRIRIGNL